MWWVQFVFFTNMLHIVQSNVAWHFCAGRKLTADDKNSYIFVLILVRLCNFDWAMGAWLLAKYSQCNEPCPKTGREKLHMPSFRTPRPMHVCKLWIQPVAPGPGGGGTQYKSGYRDVPQTWVAKSGRQVHQWVPFFQKHGTLMGLFFKIF